MNQPKNLQPTVDRLQAENAALKAQLRERIVDMREPAIPLTLAEVTSGLSRVRWAEGLIMQLPKTHEGRNSWLQRYGVGPGDGKFDYPRTAKEAIERMREDGDADPEGTAQMNYPELFLEFPPDTRLKILEPSEPHQGPIVVFDTSHNDVAEFHHDEHATTSVSYATALSYAQALVAAVRAPHRVIEAAEALLGMTHLTVQWGDGQETVECVSDRVAACLGYVREEGE